MEFKVGDRVKVVRKCRCGCSAYDHLIGEGGVLENYDGLYDFKLIFDNGLENYISPGVHLTYSIELASPPKNIEEFL